MKIPPWYEFEGVITAIIIALLLYAMHLWVAPISIFK